MEMDEERIRERIQTDNRTMEKSFYDMLSLVVGDKQTLATEEMRSQSARSSVEEICKYYHVPYERNGAQLNDVSVQIDRMLRPAGYLHRSVKLTGEWWKQSRSAMLGKSADGKTVIALIPRPFDGYTFFDYSLGKRIKVGKDSTQRIGKDAIAFSRPLPQSRLKTKSLFAFIRSLANARDYLIFFLISLMILLISLSTPWGVNFLLEKLVPLGNVSLVTSLFSMLIGLTIAQTLLEVSKIMMQKRIRLGLVGEFQGALIARLLYLPSTFFSSYSSGELATIVSAVNGIPVSLSSLVMGSGFTILLSFIYLFQINLFASPLLPAALLVLTVQMVISLVGLKMGENLRKESIRQESKLASFVYNVYDGIQKIKNAGAEKRVFGMWTSRYRQAKEPVFHMPLFLRYHKMLLSLVSFGGTALFAWLSVRKGVSVSGFVAFNLSYGMMSTAFSSLIDVVSTAAEIGSALEVGRPILMEVPELTRGNRFVEHLEGKIEVNNVSFSYPDQSGKVLQHLSFSIKSGEYVAFVGKTGCGKSTLIKLLLGFAKPQEGAIYYDGTDLNTLDLPSLRSHIGTVLQTGKLFSGDIISNITIMNNSISEDDVWAAAEVAGIADDIRNMPLGLYTHVSEGAGSLSGGQRQRLMIARALVCHPSMIIFDEAMSALDYLTQKHISESLEKMQCTRIIVAHRVSTIRQCDKIFVLDGGRIAEEGTFDELEAKGGLFTTLTKRQTL